MDLDFSNKNVLVFGGSKGIGLGVVKSFSERGANVFYASRSKNKLKKSNIHFLKVNVKNKNEIDKMFEKNFKRKNLDILINATGINYAKLNNKISFKEWKEVLDVNLSSYFYICKLALKIMRKKKAGKIVNVSSIAGRHRSVISGAHYVSSKSGIIGLTKQLAFESAKYNININVVCPSQTKTEMLKKTMSKKQISSLIKNIPLRRIASVDEQVGPILFLSSTLSDYITGACLDVNGGQYS